MATATKTISFRVDASVAEFVDEQAKARGLERSDFLRELLTAALADTKQDDLLYELGEAREQIRRLRDDLAKVAVLVLTRHPSAERMTVEQAKAVVTRVLSQ